MRKKLKRAVLLLCLLAALLYVPASAASSAAGSGAAGAAAGAGGNVAGAVTQTWKSVAGQIKTVVNTVVFPALDLILGVALFCKAATLFFEYRKHGQFEWTGVAILFACLIFTLTAPAYIWGIVGI